MRSATGLDLNADILGWIGDAAVFARGTTLKDLTAGIVVKDRNTAAAAVALRKLGALIVAKVKKPARAATHGGTTVITAPNLPAPIVLGPVEGGLTVLAYGTDAATRSVHTSSSLADSPAWARAKRELGADPSMLVVLDPILQLAESLGAGSDPQYAKAKSYLQAFTGLAAGAVKDGDVERGRVVLELR